MFQSFRPAASRVHYGKLINVYGLAVNNRQTIHVQVEVFEALNGNYLCISLKF